MEICDFTYHRVESLREACALGRELGSAARFLAGGTEVLVDLRQRRYGVAHLIALDEVAEPRLRGVRRDGGALRVGALATLEELGAAAAVRERFPALAEAVRGMAGVQIRNRATIGGNFCAAVPCADTPPVCVVGDARLRVVSADGERELPAEALFVGPRQTALAPGEVLCEIVIPAQPAGSGAAYARFARRRANTLATASAAARVVLEGGRIAQARIALGAVAPVPLRAVAAEQALEGRAPTEDALAEAAQRAAVEARPIDDFRASAEYRRELVAALTLRALRGAVERARGAAA